MADPATDLMHSGPMGALIGMGVTLASAIAAALKFNSRIAAAEEKATKAEERAEKAEKALTELEDKIELRLKSMEKDIESVERSPSSTAVQGLIANSMQPAMDKMLELREKVADITGQLRALSASGR